MSTDEVSIDEDGPLLTDIEVGPPDLGRHAQHRLIATTRAADLKTSRASARFSQATLCQAYRSVIGYLPHRATAPRGPIPLTNGRTTRRPVAQDRPAQVSAYGNGR